MRQFPPAETDLRLLNGKPPISPGQSTRVPSERGPVVGGHPRKPWRRRPHQFLTHLLSGDVIAGRPIKINSGRIRPEDVELQRLSPVLPGHALPGGEQSPPQPPATLPGDHLDVVEEGAPRNPAGMLQRDPQSPDRLAVGLTGQDQHALGGRTVRQQPRGLRTGPLIGTLGRPVTGRDVLGRVLGGKVVLPLVVFGLGHRPHSHLGHSENFREFGRNGGVPFVMGVSV